MSHHQLKISICGIALIATGLLTSCEKDKAATEVSLKGTTWKLQATINARNGELSASKNTNPIILSFDTEGKYEFRAERKALAAPYTLLNSDNSVICKKSIAAVYFSKETQHIYKAVLSATQVELVGSSLKLIDQKARTFLVFERTR